MNSRLLPLSLRRMLSCTILGLAITLSPFASARQQPASSQPSSGGGADNANEQGEPALTPEQVEEMFREPPSHLAPMPAVRIDSSKHEASVEQRDEVARLIEQLSQIDKPDFGMAPWMSGSQFAPIPNSQQFGSGIIMVDHGLKTAESLVKLVELGPKALPALLDSLSDATPTQHTMEHGGGFGGMWYGREVPLNAAQAREAAVKNAHPDFFKADAGGFDNHITEHAITRGDVCFTIIGQIVNRNYEASRYQPTACNVINSPTHDPEMAKVVREIWDSSDPVHTLFTSLLTDFHSRGGAARYQAGAAMRLLYYFPSEARQLILNRLQSMNAASPPDNATDEQWKRRSEANGELEPAELIQAVSFSDDPDILQAILRLVEQIDEPYTLSECLNDRIAAAAPDMIFKKLEAFLENPELDRGPVGNEFWPLHIAAKHYPDRARTMFEQSLARNELKVDLACVSAVAALKPPPKWTLELLGPLLDDRSPTNMEYGPDYDRKPMFVCDFAAERLAKHIKNGSFKMEGERADLDRQIDSLKRRLAGQPVAEVAEPMLDIDAVPPIAPFATFSIDDTVGTIYDFSDGQSLYVSYGYQANCWACDTMTIDVATGKTTSRVKFDEWNGAVQILNPIVGDTAVCFHNNAGGDIVTRDIRTGKELNRIATPFHEGLGRDDPMVVRGLGDIYLTGDGKHAIAFTPDGALHSVNVETGLREILWKREGKPRFEEMGFRGSIVPVRGSNRMMLEFFAEDDQPLRIWDHDARTMSEVRKVPNDGWRSAWGRFAVNHMNGHIVAWDLEARSALKLPLPEDSQISDITFDGDQTALFATLTDGAVWVIDPKTLAPRARLQTPETRGRTTLTASRDDRWLFWRADETQYDRKTGERRDPKTTIAVFDVSNLTK